MALKVGTKNVLQVYCGNKAVKEVVSGDKVVFYLPDITLENSSLSNWEASGERGGIGSGTSTTFHYSDEDANKAPVSSTHYTDSEITGWADVEDESTYAAIAHHYHFNCAHYEQFYLPQWVRDELNAGTHTITCTASANIWSYTETGKVSDRSKAGLTPADTESFMVIRQNENTAAVSNIFSPGKPAVERSTFGSGETHKEASGSASVTVTLVPGTKEITWMCLFNPRRIQVGKTCDYSEHKTTFTNITLTFTRS